MNVHTVAKVLRRMGVQNVDTRTRSTQLYIQCPLAPWTHKSGKDSSNGFSISLRPLDNSPCRCWNEKCAFKGNLYSLAKRFSMLSQTTVDTSDLEFTPEDVISSFDVYVVDDKWKQGLVALQEPYRFLTPELAQKFGVLYHNEHHRVVFPIIDRTTNELIGGVGRKTDKTTWHATEAKYFNYGHFHKHSHLFMQHDQQHEDCILVEGPMDCLSLKRCDIPFDVFAVMGATLSPEQADIIRCYRRVVLMFDCDNAGKNATISACTELITNCILLVPTHALPVKDPGEATIEQLTQSILTLATVKASL